VVTFCHSTAPAPRPQTLQTSGNIARNSSNYNWAASANLFTPERDKMTPRILITLVIIAVIGVGSMLVTGGFTAFIAHLAGAFRDLDRDR
jgi:hypothetical protein